MRNSFSRTRKPIVGPVIHLGVVSEISGECAWLLSDYALSDNSWKMNDTEGETRFQWQHPPADLRIGTLWSFRGDSLTASVLPTVDADTEKTDPPHNVSEVRFRSLSPVAVKRNVSSVKTRDSLSPVPQKIHDSFEALEAIRKEYFDEGTETPPHGPLFVSIPDYLFLGPLSLSRDGDGRWRCHGDAPIEFYAPLATSKYQKIMADGLERYVLKPRTTPPQPLGSLDLRPHDSFLADWLAHMGQEAPETLSALSKVNEALLRRTVPELSEYAELRLQASLDRVQNEETTRVAVWRRMLEMPSVKAMIDEATTQSKEEAVRMAQSALAEATAKEEDLQARIASAQVVLDSLQAQTRQVSEAAVAATEERSLQAMTQTAEAFALAIRQLPASSSGTVSRQRSASAYFSMPNAAVPNDLPSLRRCLLKQLQEWEVADAPLVAAQMTAAWLCGLAPVIAGSAGTLVSRLAASAFAGGRLHMVDVPTAAAETADLFGRPHLLTSLYTPHPGGLADLFLDESNEARLHVVAFEGVNRCDADAVFFPIFESSERSWDGGRRLPLLHSYSVSADDAYRSLASAIWPRNFLPLFVYSPGMSGLPLSSAFWARSALIVAETGASGFPPPVGDVSLEAWAKLRAGISLQSVPVPRATRFQQALGACGVLPEMSARAIHEALALPPQIVAGSEIASEGELQAMRIRRALFGSA